MKAILNPETVNQYIDYHKALKLKFTLTLSNYTTRIKSDYIDIHFMKSEQPNRVFSAYNKVKSEATKKKVKRIDSNSLQYFSHSFKDTDFYSDVIYNIDIKSAYASILYNDGFISKETYNYIQRLPKMERLAAVGMLAGKKNIFEVDADGNVISEQTVISQTADYFFYCVKKTSEIINEASQHLGKGFLFSWVDGIYFLQEEKSAIVAGDIMKEFFKEKGYNVSFDILKEFTVNVKKNHFACSFIKDGKTKTMKVPKIESVIIKKITNHLLNKDYGNA